MVLIILIIGAAIGGFIGGYKVAYWHLSKTTDALSMQSSLLHSYSNYWSQEAQSKYNLLQYVSGQQVTNTNNSMQVVLHLLQTIQREQAQTLSKEEQEKVTQLISQAKAITSP